LFFNLNYKTFRIFEGFDQLYNSIGWQVTTRQNHWHCGGLTVLEG